MNRPATILTWLCLLATVPAPRGSGTDLLRRRRSRRDDRPERFAAVGQGLGPVLYRLGAGRSFVHRGRAVTRVGRARHVRARCPLGLAHPSRGSDPDRHLGAWVGAGMGWPEAG